MIVFWVVYSVGLYFCFGGLYLLKVILISKGRICVFGVGIFDVFYGDLFDDFWMF